MDKKKIKNFSIVYAILFVVLFVYVLSMLTLLLWGFFTSLKEPGIKFNNNVLGLPEGAPWEWKWSNYSEIFASFQVPVKRWVNGVLTPMNIGFSYLVLYTLLYAGVGAVIAAVVPMAVAYVTAKFKCFMSSVVYTIVVVTMIIPIIGAQTSELQILRTLNLYDTFFGAWLLKFNFLGMYYLVFYGTFKGISKEYSEAAYIDGASEWTVFTHIMIPFAKIVLSTIVLLKFIDFWNDYQMPLLYIPSHPTLAYAVWKISDTNYDAPSTLTTCFIVTIPILIIFIVAKDKLMGNISMGGVKE